MNPARLKLPVLTVFILLFIVILGWGGWLQTQSVHTTDANYAYNLGYALLYLIGAIAGFIGARYVTTTTAMGRAFLWLGAAQLSYAAGLIMWAYYNLIAHVAVPYPSAADVFFALFYALLAVGCWHFLSMVAGNIHVQYLFEVLGIFFISSVVILGFLNTPDGSASLPILTKIFNIWYPMGDSLLIALSYLVFRASRDRFQSGIIVLIMGLLVQVFADIIFSGRSAANLYWNGDVSDILFAVSGFVLSLGILMIFFDFTSDTPETHLPRAAS